MSRLHEMKTGAVPPKLPVKMEASPRRGTHTKTIAKTARALGFNYTPTLGFRARKQGEGGKDYQKRVKARFQEDFEAKQKGDRVTTP